MPNQALLTSSEPNIDELLLQYLFQRLERSNKKERRVVSGCIQELEVLLAGTQEEQALAWFFLHFGQGYGYVIRNGERLASRQGWLTPFQMGCHLGVIDHQPHYLGIRPAGTTTWVLIDIDEGSRYHPQSLEGEGDLPIKEALSRNGLIMPIEIQSSLSTGIHLLYPLPQAMPTWELANQLEQALIGAGIQVKPGVLELRPNAKNFQSNYLAIRAPLTGEGNAFWAPEYGDFGLLENLVLFKQMYCSVQKCNSWKPLQNHSQFSAGCSPNRRGPVTSKGVLETGRERLEEGFTGPKQTNDLTFIAQQQARLVEGFDTLQSLRHRCSELVRNAPGFAEFCGHQKQILDGCYWTDKTLLKALAMSPGGYIGTWREKSNQDRSKEAVVRALIAIQQAEEEGTTFQSLNSAISYLKELGAPAASWWKNPKNHHVKEKLYRLLTRQIGSSMSEE